MKRLNGFLSVIMAVVLSVIMMPVTSEAHCEYDDVTFYYDIQDKIDAYGDDIYYADRSSLKYEDRKNLTDEMWCYGYILDDSPEINDEENTNYIRVRVILPDENGEYGMNTETFDGNLLDCNLGESIFVKIPKNEKNMFIEDDYIMLYGKFNPKFTEYTIDADGIGLYYADGYNGI